MAKLVHNVSTFWGGPYKSQELCRQPATEVWLNYNGSFQGKITVTPQSKESKMAATGGTGFTKLQGKSTAHTTRKLGEMN